MPFQWIRAFPVFLLIGIVILVVSSTRLVMGTPRLAEDNEENLGDISIDNIVIATEFEFIDSQRGNFDIGESLVSFLWQKEAKLSGIIQLGSQRLINTPKIFQDIVMDELGIYEAYAQYHGAYGKLRVGLIPIEFGVEGRTQEHQLDFSRSLIFSQRIVGLRDYGLSYSIQHQGFYTKLAIHNGEAGRNLDGRIYYTASWGWSNRYIDMGMMGHTGETKAESTLLQSSNLGGVDLSLTSRWTMGGPYLRWHPGHWDFLVEYMQGSLDQKRNPKAGKFRSGHVDLSYAFGGKIKLMTRYDHLDPHLKVTGDRLDEISLGVVFLGKYGNSRLTLLATKVLEEGVNIINDRYSLTWKITPKSMSK